MFDNCSAGGMALASADVCKTPPLASPETYANTADRPTAIPNVANMLINAAPIHNENTMIPFTTGDEPGSEGGVASGTVSAQSRDVTGSGKVMVKGSPVTRLTDTNLPNDQNTAGQTVQPSQTIVMTLS